jgi:BirA family biotin operon repressor/biotin-[acetyl-CoA-carboxylase] ligase
MTLRDKVIFILESNKGSFVSGQDIASVAGVSRSAVAKCIATLKGEGYRIRSVNNSGHCLEAESDILSVGGITANLGGDIAEVAVFDSIDSTNSEAKRLVANGLERDALIAANGQTAGRGRRGRSFYSPADDGLYFSCVLHPTVSLSESTAITSACAVAVCEIIGEEIKKDPMIKWVNDIFIDNLKVCGILTEAISDFESGRVQAVIVGIGINLTTSVFPDELNGIAASLGARVDRCRLAAKIFKRLSELCYALPDKSFMDEYRRRSLALGRTVYFNRNGIDHHAVAKAVHDDCSLEVALENGEIMLLNSGEISIKLDRA